jgi:ABC-type sugar transport system substrate-binding protein
MVSLPEMRKAIIKEGLIPTVLRNPDTGKKRAAKAALKVKQGEKSDQFAEWRRCLRSRRTGHV